MINILKNHIHGQTTIDSNDYVKSRYDYFDEVHLALKEKNWSQTELADKMRVSLSEIYQIVYNKLHKIKNR